MKEEIWNSGAPVRKEDRDHHQQSLQEAVRERFSDTLTSGVVKDSQFAGESRPFELSEGVSDLEINVGSGVAYAKHNADGDRPESIDASVLTAHGGERIVIPEADTLAGQDYRNDPGLKTGTYKESSDGLGGFTPTPESTLTRNVPLTALSLNYIWLGYLRTVNSGETVLHKVSPEIMYPFAEDGYKIIVTTSPSAPSPDMLLLGTADVTSGGAPVFDQSGMTFSRVRSKRTNVALSDDLKPATYTIPGTGSESTVPLEDHVNAQGTGTGATVANPHNMSIEDMGIPLENIDLTTHRKTQHVDGIHGDSAATTSSLFVLLDSSNTEVPLDSGMVVLKQLAVNEYVYLDGKRNSEVWPKLETSFPGSSIGDVYVSFGNQQLLNTDATVNPYKPVVQSVPPNSGTYVIYLAYTPVLTARMRFGTTVNPGELPIAYVEWDGATLSGLVDLRPFGTTGSENIQDAAIKANHLDTSAVTTAKINDDAVTSDKVGDDAILSRHIQIADATDPADPNTGQGIATDHIRDEAVTLAKLADDARSAAPTWTKYSIDYTDIGGGGYYIFDSGLSTRSVIHTVIIKHSTPWAGAGILNPYLSVGHLSGRSDYASPFPVWTATDSQNYQISNPVSIITFDELYATITLESGDVANLNAGAADIWVMRSIYPV